MQKCYEAIYDHGELEWLGVPPNFQNAQMIVVTGDDEELTEFHNTITATLLTLLGKFVYRLSEN